MESTVDKQPFIVMDLGSKQIKVGFSGEDRPRITIPNQVYSNDIDEKKYYQVGDEILDFLKLKLDETGKAGDFVESIFLTSEGDPKKEEDDLNKVIDLIKYIQSNFLKVDSAKYGLLLIDNFDIDVKIRGKITSKIMSDVRPDQFCMMKAPMLSLFATGRTTGLVLDCGDSITSVCAVYEGYTLPHAIEWQRYGGSNSTDAFNNLIKEKRPELDLKDHKVIRDMLKLKEKVCRVRKRRDGAEDDPNINKKFLIPTHTLPDGNQLKDKKEPEGSLLNLDARMIYDPMEMMFIDSNDVSNLPTESGNSKSLKKMIQETIEKCDSDIMKTLKDNIVVGGGNSMPEGFRDRIRDEVPDCVLEFDPYRNFSSWVGGSMLASTSVFCDKACLKKDAENSKDQTNKVKTVFFN